MEGDIIKLGSFGRQNKRYAVISGNILRLFEKKGASKPVEEVKLRRAHIKATGDKKSPLSFTIQSSDGTVHTFIASDEASMKLWIAKLVESSVQDSKDVIIRQGYVMKRSATGFRGLQKRFLVLKPYELVYFENAEDTEPHGVIPLLSIRDVNFSDGKDRMLMMFDTKAQRPYEFQMSSTTELQDWFRDLADCVRRIETAVVSLQRMWRRRKQRALLRKVSSRLNVERDFMNAQARKIQIAWRLQKATAKYNRLSEGVRGSTTGLEQRMAALFLVKLYEKKFDKAVESKSKARRQRNESMHIADVSKSGYVEIKSKVLPSYDKRYLTLDNALFRVYKTDKDLREIEDQFDLSGTSPQSGVEVDTAKFTIKATNGLREVFLFKLANTAELTSWRTAVFSAIQKANFEMEYVVEVEQAAAELAAEKKDKEREESQKQEAAQDAEKSSGGSGAGGMTESGDDDLDSLQIPTRFRTLRKGFAEFKEGSTWVPRMVQLTEARLMGLANKKTKEAVDIPLVGTAMTPAANTKDKTTLELIREVTDEKQRYVLKFSDEDQAIEWRKDIDTVIRVLRRKMLLARKNLLFHEMNRCFHLWVQFRNLLRTQWWFEVGGYDIFCPKVYYANETVGRGSAKAPDEPLNIRGTKPVTNSTMWVTALQPITLNYFAESMYLRAEAEHLAYRVAGESGSNGDVQIIQSSLFKKTKAILTGDPCSYHCWEVLARSQDKEIAVIIARRLHLPPLGETFEDLVLTMHMDRREGEPDYEVLDMAEKLINMASKDSSPYNREAIQNNMLILDCVDRSFTWVPKKLDIHPPVLLTSAAEDFCREVAKMLDQHNTKGKKFFTEDGEEEEGVYTGSDIADPFSAIEQMVEMYPIEGDAVVSKRNWRRNVARYLAHSLDSREYVKSLNMATLLRFSTLKSFTPEGRSMVLKLIDYFLDFEVPGLGQNKTDIQGGAVVPKRRRTTVTRRMSVTRERAKIQALEQARQNLAQNPDSKEAKSAVEKAKTILLSKEFEGSTTPLSPKASAGTAKEPAPPPPEHLFPDQISEFPLPSVLRLLYASIRERDAAPGSPALGAAHPSTSTPTSTPSAADSPTLASQQLRQATLANIAKARLGVTVFSDMHFNERVLIQLLGSNYFLILLDALDYEYAKKTGKIQENLLGKAKDAMKKKVDETPADIVGSNTQEVEYDSDYEDPDEDKKGKKGSKLKLKNINELATMAKNVAKDVKDAAIDAAKVVGHQSGGASQESAAKEPTGPAIYASTWEDAVHLFNSSAQKGLSCNVAKKTKKRSSFDAPVRLPDFEVYVPFLVTLLKIPNISKQLLVQLCVEVALKGHYERFSNIMAEDGVQILIKILRESQDLVVLRSLSPALVNLTANTPSTKEAAIKHDLFAAASDFCRKHSVDYKEIAAMCFGMVKNLASTPNEESRKKLLADGLLPFLIEEIRFFATCPWTNKYQVLSMIIGTLWNLMSLPELFKQIVKDGSIALLLQQVIEEQVQDDIIEKALGSAMIICSRDPKFCRNLFRSERAVNQLISVIRSNEQPSIVRNACGVLRCLSNDEDVAEAMKSNKLVYATILERASHFKKDKRINTLVRAICDNLDIPVSEDGLFRVLLDNKR